MNIPPDGLLIEVTEEDIKIGQEGNVFHCPISLAVKRAIKVNGGVIVLSSRIFVNRDEECFMPKEVKEFVTLFDSRKPTTPFTFTLIRRDVQDLIQGDIHANLL